MLQLFHPVQGVLRNLFRKCSSRRQDWARMRCCICLCGVSAYVYVCVNFPSTWEHRVAPIDCEHQMACVASMLCQQIDFYSFKSADIHSREVVHAVGVAAQRRRAWQPPVVPRLEKDRTPVVSRIGFATVVPCTSQSTTHCPTPLCCLDLFPLQIYQCVCVCVCKVLLPELMKVTSPAVAVSCHTVAAVASSSAMSAVSCCAD